MDPGANHDGDRPALPSHLHDPEVRKPLVRIGWSYQVPARRAVERDGEDVAGWVKETWTCAEDSPRPVAPGSSSRTKLASP
ncbi:winged helix-turn-helix domain-containing protein [Streptomyces parvulus]